jgi:hypothetical protein
MKQKANILTKAGVLLIAAVMVLSALPAIAAETDGITKNDVIFSQPTRVNYPVGSIMGDAPLNVGEGSFADGFFADAWLGYSDMESENGLGLTSGGSITMMIVLTSTELAGWYGETITEVNFDAGSDSFGPALATPFELFIEPGLPAYGDLYTGGVNVVHTGTTDGALVMQGVTLGTPYDIPGSGDVCVGITFTHVAGEYPCGIDESSTTPDRGQYVSYDGFGSIDTLTNIGFPGLWCIEVGVGEGGGGPEPGDCIEDACDFQLWGFSPEFNA